MLCSRHWESSCLPRGRMAEQHKIPSPMVKTCLFHLAFAWSLNPPFPGSRLGTDWWWAANQLCFVLAELLGKLMNPDLILHHEALISNHLWKFNTSLKPVFCRPEKSGSTVRLCSFRLWKWDTWCDSHLSHFLSSRVKGFAVILDLHFQSDPQDLKVHEIKEKSTWVL